MDALPQQVQQIVTKLTAPEPCTEREIATKLKGQVTELRTLSIRKNQLQVNIDGVKAQNASLLTGMQDLQSKLADGQKALQQLSQDYMKGVNQTPAPSDHAAPMGEPEQIPMEEQKSQLHGLLKRPIQDPDDLTKRRKTDGPVPPLTLCHQDSNFNFCQQRPAPGDHGSRPRLAVIGGTSNPSGTDWSSMAATTINQRVLYDYATSTDLLMQNLTMIVGNLSQRCFANAAWRAFTWLCAFLQEHNTQFWGTVREAVQESLETCEAVDLQQLPGLQTLWQEYDLNVQGDAGHFVNTLWLATQSLAFTYRYAEIQPGGFLKDRIQMPIHIDFPVPGAHQCVVQ